LADVIRFPMDVKSRQISAEAGAKAGAEIQYSLTLNYFSLSLFNWFHRVHTLCFVI